MRQLDDMPNPSLDVSDAPPPATRPPEYRVLARKYRPSSFAELIGHDTLVRTLSNAFASGRIAHAFMLTGVRGVGKTTTARIVARALNCTGPDGKGGPTMTPCGQCDACRSIAEDRHPDVLELDAASRTGIDDMREVIDNVRYRPVSARYKVYIIDEVHMLSKAAFNALLKTLEEPPPDVKFIFATTEINKVPITVLSRCQRYTLPRIDGETLIAHYASIAQKEQVEIEPGALALLARAADGSVRDGLSILDQAIALSYGQAITETQMRDMLGVADRGLVLDLFEALMAGNAAAALGQLETLYNGGTDPSLVMQELLDITHLVTRLKFEREETNSAIDGGLTARARIFAQRLGVAALTRTWQMLLKGLAEMMAAPNPFKAAEMVLIRLVHVADLPPPGDLVKAIQAKGGAAAYGAPSGGGNGGGGAPRARLEAVQGGAARAMVQPMAEPALAVTAQADLPQPANFVELVELVAKHREGILYTMIANFVRLVRFEPGRIDFAVEGDAPRDLSQRLGAFMTTATGRRWLVAIVREAGQPTLRQQADMRARRRQAVAEADPLVSAALAMFPGAKISKIVELLPDTDDSVPPPEMPIPEIAADTGGDDDRSPNLYEEDDPGPFVSRSDPYDPDEEEED